MAFSLLATLVAGCTGADPDGDVQVAVAHLDAKSSNVGGALVIRDKLGKKRHVKHSDLQMTASVEGPDGEWIDVKVRPSDNKPRLNTVVVADNSGSQEDDLDLMQKASRRFGEQFLTSGDDKLGLVRVSTESRVLTELTNDPEQYDAAVDAMFVSNGWTALYDGIRIANETLAAGTGVERKNKNWGCVDRPLNAIVVFTDGRDNNSSDMQMTKYEGDGIDTRLSDLLELDVLGVRTPVYAVGAGRAVDETSLRELSEATGGFYAPIDSYKDLFSTLEQQAHSLKNAAPFCFELPYCDAELVRLEISFDLDGEKINKTVELDIPGGACAVERSAQPAMRRE